MVGPVLGLCTVHTQYSADLSLLGYTLLDTQSSFQMLTSVEKYSRCRYTTT
jgi:hypothetical protein